MSGELYAEGYFVIIPEWVLDADISDKAVRLYGVLRSYADHRTGVAFPSRRTLAGRLRIADVKGVDRALAELEDIGAVEVQRATNAPGQTRTSNRYCLRHTNSGISATPPLPLDEQTGSSYPRGANAIGGTDATPPMAPAPQGQGRQDHRAYGASAPLTRPRELEGESASHSPAQSQLRLVDHPTPEEQFAAFWAAYPKKVGKDAARRAWAKAIRRADVDKIVEVVSRYPFRPDRQFVKDPATWLNAGCWEDDLEAVAAANRGRSVTSRAYGAAHQPYQDPPPSTPNAFPERF